MKPVAPTDTSAWQTALTKMQSPTSQPVRVLYTVEQENAFSLEENRIRKMVAYGALAVDHVVTMGVKSATPFVAAAGTVKSALQAPCTVSNVISVVPLTGAAFVGGTVLGVIGAAGEGFAATGCLLGATGQGAHGVGTASYRIAKKATTAALQAAQAALRAASDAWAGMHESLAGKRA